MLTRPSRQLASTLALALLTVAPTIYVIHRAYGVRQPAHLREVEAEIGRRLGVLAHVSRATHPRPDVDLLEGVALRLDNAAHAEIARADTLRITRERGDMNLRVPNLSLRGNDASDALGQVIALMRRLATAETGRISLVADRCEVAIGARAEVIHDLAAILETVRGTPTLTASYLVEDQRKHGRTRCEMTVRREVNDAGTVARVGLKTLDGAVPAALLSPFFDAGAWLGPNATLDGSLTFARGDGRDWGAEFRGELSDVDLASVVGRRFAGHRLTGLARLSIESARWGERPGGQGPGWVEARGMLSAGPGSISVGLLRALESRMRFRVTGPVDPRSRDVEFQGLGLSFAMNSGGELTLGGGLGSEYAPDAVLVQGHRALPLARAPEGTANVRGLLNTLIPAAPESLGPVVPEAHALGALPLPAGHTGSVSAN